MHIVQTRMRTAASLNRPVVTDKADTLRLRPAGALMFLLVLLLVSASAQAVTVTPVATGLNSVIGQAYHPTTHQIYFVEWNSGKLARLDPVTGAVTTLAGGFTTPEDVALLPGTNTAYVTTRDSKLWKVNTSTGVHSVVVGGLGMPHELALDPVLSAAYIVDFGGGKLWKVELGSGAKTALVTGLSTPIGLLMSSDFGTAYVAEPTRILKINLSTLTITEVVTGLTNAFFMDWANDAHSAIYIVQRDPVSGDSRVDLATTPATLSLIAAVPYRPSSVVRSFDPGVIYVASDTVISRVSLADGSGGPVITRLGFIPSTNIDFTTGQATTDPGYFFHVTNASFGGSVQVMMNFPGMLASGASYYRVFLDASSTGENAAWTNYKWDGSRFVLSNVVPNSNRFYKIPLASDLWAIPDMGFVLNTTSLTNLRHRLRVRLYDAAFAPLAVAEDQVAVLVDNNAPVMQIQQIRHDGVPLDECALITSGSSDLEFTFKAFDPEAHLYSYALTDRWGHGHSATITSDQYAGAHDSSLTWSGVNPAIVGYTLSCAQCSHSFYLDGWANTTNGYNYIHYSSDLDHVAIYLPGGSCL